MSLPRMRTAEGVFSAIKEADPDAQITLYYIRCLLASGKLPVVKSGNRVFVNLDAVLEYLATGEPLEAPSVPAYGKIRRVG